MVDGDVEKRLVDGAGVLNHERINGRAKHRGNAGLLALRQPGEAGTPQRKNSCTYSTASRRASALATGEPTASPIMAHA